MVDGVVRRDRGLHAAALAGVVVAEAAVAAAVAPVVALVALVAAAASLVLSASEARKAVVFAETYQVEDVGLLDLVSDISTATGVSMPAVCSSMSPEINASATAWRGRNALDISSGFRDVYGPTAPETTGVLLHEFGHLARRDHQVSRLASALLLTSRVVLAGCAVLCLSGPPSRLALLAFAAGCALAANGVALALARDMEVGADEFVIEYNGAAGLARAFVDWNSAVLRPAFDRASIPRDQAEYGARLLAVEREIAHLNRRLARDPQRLAMLGLVEQALVSARKAGPFGLPDVALARSRWRGAVSLRTWAARAIVPGVDMHPSLDDRLSLLGSVTAVPEPREWLTDESARSDPGTLADTEARVARALAPWLASVASAFGASLTSESALPAPLVGSEFAGSAHGRSLLILVSAEVVAPGLARLVVSRRGDGGEVFEIERDWSVIDDEEAADFARVGAALVGGAASFAAGGGGTAG